MKDEQGWRRRRREEDLVDRYQEDAFNRSHVVGSKGVHGAKADFSKWFYGLGYFANVIICIQLRILWSLVV